MSGSPVHHARDSPQEPLALATKALLAARFMLAAGAVTFGDLIGELLLTPRKGWRPLEPNLLTKQYEVFLGGEAPIWTQRILAGGALPATDNFNRADETPLAGNWTTHAGAGVGCSLFSNQAIGNVGLACSFWNADVFANDQYSQAVVAAASACSPAIRIRSAVQYDAYVSYMPSSGTVSIYKIINGSLTLLTTPNFAFAVSDVIKLDGVGSTLTMYKNAVAQASPATDSAITAGSAGIFGDSSAFVCDNWEGGNVGGAAVRMEAIESFAQRRVERRYV